LATLAYRMVSYWLRLIAGAVPTQSFAAGTAPADTQRGAPCA
jgi:hypothetical protein